MSQGLDVNVKDLVLSNSPFGPGEVRQLVDAISADYSNYRLLREAVQELDAHDSASPAGAVRLGVCNYLLGRYRAAVERLSNADGGAMAHFYLAKSQAALENYDAALKAYDAAATAGYDRGSCALGRCDVLRSSGKQAEALAELDKLSGPVEQSAEYLYQRGATVASLGSNPEEVIALFERAVEADPKHAGALFGLALENDRHGNDDEAINLYQRSASRFPTYVGTLFNLGVLFEDHQNYEKARQCYQRILEGFPDHPRARLFLKDAMASGEMFYDEDAQKRRDRLGQVLNIPVTDFELSVRSRNCLHKMGLITLGDLARTTEQDLLASKNFGETSLSEIKEVLASRGLELGQFATERQLAAPTFDTETMSADEQMLLSQPIADLNLSVRARKCMIRLGIATIGELVRRTGDELLECKNFGVTSLNEVREKLTLHNLRLRGD